MISYRVLDIDEYGTRGGTQYEYKYRDEVLVFRECDEDLVVNLKKIIAWREHYKQSLKNEKYESDQT